jgi:hypothetical protein
MRAGLLYVSLTLTTAALLLISTTAGAWDSAAGNPGRPTHSLMTEWAINKLQASNPEVQQYRAQLIEGANEELHELTVSGQKHGIDLDAKRKQHRGTNEGCDDIQGWWQDSLAAYKQGNKAQAYYLLGIMLHMIQDMGVPAHAHKVIHQGNATEFDNFEYMALSNWRPSFPKTAPKDPGHAEPWKYYAVSKNWTLRDAPSYKSRDQFSKTWLLASQADRDLLTKRQAGTCYVTMWALQSAAKAFKPAPTIAGRVIRVHYQGGALAAEYTVDAQGMKHGTEKSYTQDTQRLQGITIWDHGKKVSEKYIPPP